MTVPVTGADPGPVKVNDVALIVAGFIARLNVADIAVFAGAARAPLRGTSVITVGEAAVVKVQTKLAASAAPVGSFAPVVIVAIYKVPVARAAVGVKVAEVPE